MQQLAERSRSEPGIALYYAALLAEEGHREEASRYLARSDGSPRLLPEEQAARQRNLGQQSLEFVLSGPENYAEAIQHCCWFK